MRVTMRGIITAAQGRLRRPSHTLGRALLCFLALVTGARAQNCPAGSGGTSCTACALGKYKTLTGSASCTNCPSLYITWTLSTGMRSITNSLCNSGYIGSGTSFVGVVSCTACAAGTYKPGVGPTPASCTLCAAGKYGTAVGAKTDVSCISCPAGKYSATTGASVAATCLACAAGTFSLQASTTCTECRLNTFSASSSATTCTSCPKGQVTTSTGQTAATACVCPPGFTGAVAPCASCEAGKFKTDAGGHACTDCGEGKYSLELGATTETVCVASCGAGKYSTQWGCPRRRQVLCDGGRDGGCDVP